MSLSIVFVKIAPAYLEKVKGGEEVLHAIFHGETPDEIDWAVDAYVADYKIIGPVLDHRREAGESVRWSEIAIGQTDFGTDLDLESFYFSPAQVAEIAVNLPLEGWDPHEAYESNIGRFFHIAAEEGCAVVGNVG